MGENRVRCTGGATGRGPGQWNLAAEVRRLPDAPSVPSGPSPPAG